VLSRGQEALHERSEFRDLLEVVVHHSMSCRLRERIKRQFGPQRRNLSLSENLRMLNGSLRGFCNFYRHAWGASRIFTALDHYLWWTILRWVQKKHGRTPCSRTVSLGTTAPKVSDRSRFARNGTSTRAPGARTTNATITACDCSAAAMTRATVS